MNALAIFTDLQPENWQFELGEMVTHRDQPMPSLATGKKRQKKATKSIGMAEGVGFEPTVGLHPRRFSRPVP